MLARDADGGSSQHRDGSSSTANYSDAITEGLTRSGLVASNVRNSSENFRSTQKLDALLSSFDGRFCKFWKL
jgi:hypothetical protein